MLRTVLLLLFLSGSATAQDTMEEPHQVGQAPAHDHEGIDTPTVSARTPGGTPAVQAALKRVAIRTATGTIRAHHVGRDSTDRSLAETLDAARAGDTVLVHGGVHEGRIRIEHPVVLIGRDGAVLDGGGEGTVLTLTDAPGSVVQGLTLRGSGRTLAREDAGLMAENSPGLKVEANRFEDVLFGVYLKLSANAVILGNDIHGAELEMANRGDAIRLWYSPHGILRDNRVQNARDVVVWFSDSVEVLDNEVSGSRYALHYMYSDHGRFSGNRFLGNLVGGFLMYSADLEFTGNVFQQSAGATGMGLGLKDTDAIVARDNLFVENTIGIHLDNSPQTIGVRNQFENNLVVRNEVGVALLPSVAGNDFTGNVFLDNVREVEVSGGGDALGNTWGGNHWSRYAGFDADDDGTGDHPFLLSSLSDQLMARHPELELFTFSPAAATLDIMARILPFLEPRPVVIDEKPLIRPGRRVNVEPAGPPAPWDRPLGMVLLALSASLALATRRLHRPPYPTVEEWR